jgi:ATP-binding cassette, subfamily F, member 3
MTDLEVSTIENILSSKLGDDFDDSIREYLVQLLLDTSLWGDLSTANHGIKDLQEALVETLAPFLDDNAPLARQIVDALFVKVAAKESEVTKDDAIKKFAPRSFNDLENDSFVGGSRVSDVDGSDFAEETELIPSHRRTKCKKRQSKNKSPQPEQNYEDEEEYLDEEDLTVGGRGRGGRGAYAGKTNSIHGNIHLYNVSLALPNGTELLTPETTHMDLLKGHRYGLIGRNGVGKSTLLRRLAQHALPGLPRDMRILLVEQQQTDFQAVTLSGAADSSSREVEPSISAIDALVSSDVDRTRLLEEQAGIEASLDERDDTNDKASLDQVTKAMERLSVIATDLDAIQADTAYERATEILRGLQFTDAMLRGPVSNLSGGWRMRLALARALFVSTYDLICLDEATNHLDLAGLDWLIHYINQSDLTMVLVSHDRTFLDAVCTDIIVMEHQTLAYHVGNYSMYEQQQLEKSTREAQILDAAERQRSKAMAFVQKQQANANKKSADPNKLRQAKMIRDKKMDRIGNYREDGKRYKLRSLKTLDEKSLRLAQHVQIEVDEPIIQMHFPNPVWPPSIGSSDSIVRMEDLSFWYNDGVDGKNTKLLLNNVTVNIQRESKIALVGSNGCGKSSLVKLIAGDHSASTTSMRGSFWIHPNLRVGHVSQYSVEELEQYANLTVLEYAEKHLVTGRVAADIVAKASRNVRQYLGAFGLGGKHALQRIGKLSGGERMRLCFATVLADNPGLLLLDESTNHCDITLLETMAMSLHDFKGAVVMVSHNQSFLSGFCNELWVLDDGRIAVTHSDTKSFDDMFSQYRSSISQKGGGVNFADIRRNKGKLAKRATKQRAGIQQDTALL